MSLREKAISGVKWTSMSSMINTIIQIAQLSILTRILSPGDFGLMAIVYVIVGFSALFVDMGVSAAIIHKQNLTVRQLSSLYWFNVFAGGTVFVTVYVLSSGISQFYDEPSLMMLIQILSVTFLINSFGNQYKILFQKELKFELLSKISIMTVAISFVIAIILALKGYGVYSLVYAALGSSMFNSLIFFFIGSREYNRPKMMFKYKEIKPMISFGMFQMADRSITYFNSQFDVILIGKLLGVEALGIYSVAKNLSMRPAKVINPIVTKVTLPVMSKVQGNIGKLKSIYLKTINYISSINFFIYILMALLAEPIIIILFGEQWMKSIVILQILSIYGAIRSTGNPQGTLLLSQGRADISFYLNVGKFSIMTIVIYIASYWGLNGVAFSLLALTTFFVLPNWYFVVRPLAKATIVEYMEPILRALMINLFSGGLAYLICNIFEINNLYLYSFLIGIIMTTAVIYMNYRYNKAFVELILEFMGKKKND